MDGLGGHPERASDPGSCGPREPGSGDLVGPARLGVSHLGVRGGQLTDPVWR